MPPDPLWYKDAIVYQVHVRAYCDGDGNGMGDLPGLISKLDYLRDLGVTAIWLLPFYPSPLRDDGYDIADYMSVHPDFGTLGDFKHLLREAHARGLRVVTELVLNHTSDQHPWFQRARRAPKGSAHRDFYVWSDTNDRYPEARVIFKDFEESNWSWDPVASAYYWHRFYKHQPDLNFDNPEVVKALWHVVDHWLDLGVDGLRLDAVPYLFEREGTNCENLPETHAALRDLRRHVDERFENRMLLAEANQWPEDAVAYFGRGDECHMAFHFPLMPRMFMALRMEDRYPVLDILSQTPEIPESCQWAVFLRNHDELTLEMVTDEERDYMYRVYAHDPRARINLGIRHRLAPLLGNDRRRIELMNGLLFSLPGTPVVYYGDEIGMGDNIFLGDRNGVRTPMQWSGDRNAGFSRANSQRLYLPVNIDPESHYEAVNVETQERNTSSLLWWMRRMISLRKRHRAFSRGTLEFLDPDNRKVLTFLRRHEDERILVVANLSRHAQFVEMDLSAHEGLRPIELFGGAHFPKIGKLPYLLTLGPHAFFWLRLDAEADDASAPVERPAAATPAAPVIHLDGGWDSAITGPTRRALERLLPRHLADRRWFAAKARGIEGARIVDTIPLGADRRAALAVLAVDFVEGDAETYLLPVQFASGPGGAQLDEKMPRETIARLSCADGDGILTSALLDRDACSALLEAVARRRSLKGEVGTILGQTARHAKGVLASPSTLEPSVPQVEQSNTSVVFGDRTILKLFRRLEEGEHPEVEMGRFLTERVRFPHVAPLLGSLDYKRDGGDSATVGVVQGFVPSEGNAWNEALDVLRRFLERAALRHDVPPAGAEAPLPELAAAEIPEIAREHIGVYLESARLLGRRTGELHVALASPVEDPAFTPEPYTAMSQRSSYQSLRNEAKRTLALLRDRMRTLPPELRDDARKVLDAEGAIVDRYRALVGAKLTARRMRVHGDLHLGQVLSTGKDYVLIDFEGEPAIPLGARRIKRSPLRDVAGMLRSFHYAATTAIERETAAGLLRQHDLSSVRAWTRFWAKWVGATYLAAYLEAVAPARVLPAAGDELTLLLDVDLLERSIYELAYELNTRPEWVHLPLAGILERVGSAR